MFALPFDFFILRVGDDKDVIAVELFGAFDEGIELTFAGFIGRNIVTHLNELLLLIPLSSDEITC